MNLVWKALGFPVRWRKQNSLVTKQTITYRRGNSKVEFTGYTQDEAAEIMYQWFRVPKEEK